MSIGSIVSLAAGKISDLLVQEVKLLYGVEDQVRSLQRELTRVNAFLTDMEAREEEGGDELTRTIITEMRKIAYDAEDVIESYIFEANFPVDKMEAFFKRYVCLCRSLPHTHQVAYEIEAINARIDKTLESWRKYAGPNGGIRTDAGAGMSRDIQRLNQGIQTRPNTYPHTDVEDVVGLEEDIKKMVGSLTTDGAEIQVLSIVGMGGSGKTTLGRKLYNHDSVKRHFDCIAWLSISKEWAAKQILMELLRKVSGNKDATCSDEELVEKIHHYLEGCKRYLIVLDDVWTQEPLAKIRPAFPKGEGRIIITTRIQDVAGFLKSSIHKPRPLTGEESWDLFSKKTLIHEEENNNSMDIDVLETLGKEMLKKCEGLPLAVIALAGILRKKKTIKHWEQVKVAVSSWIMTEKCGVDLYGPVNKMLTLSYNDLPCHLKPCLLYLAMFPEDDEIQVGTLIRMWVAEGFITYDMCIKGETLEDVGRRVYLEELIDRCVVQIASKSVKGNVKSIRVHDLVRDLCIKKAKQQAFLEMLTSQSSESSHVSELRRTAIYSLNNNYVPLPTQSPLLRSLLYEVVDPDFQLNYQMPSLENIHHNFRLLRVLHLDSVRTSNETLPTGIGSLIHLRYLVLRYTNIYKLPPSIGNLRNLLTLECTQGRFSDKSKRTDIPDVLWKIEGLRHISLDFVHSIEGRAKLHTLKQLQTIKGIGGGSWMLQELPYLSPTVQKLKIRRISSEEQLEAALRCPSIRSDTLHSLGLRWNHDPTKGKVVVLENLQPISQSQHLRKLFLMGRMQDRLSCCNQFPTSIIKLELWYTWFEEETELAALDKRLPNLMSLTLGENAYVGAKWTLMEFQFQRLKELFLYFLNEWEEWSIERGAMPQLSKLRILECEKLRRLPEGLKFVTTLEELELWDVGDELKKRAKGGGEDGGGEDAHIIQHVPRVDIWL